jgi:hypothetical protein
MKIFRLRRSLEFYFAERQLIKKGKLIPLPEGQGWVEKHCRARKIAVQEKLQSKKNKKIYSAHA